MHYKIKFFKPNTNIKAILLEVLKMLGFWLLGALVGYYLLSPCLEHLLRR